MNAVGGGAIKIEDVHPHWRFEKPGRPPPPASLPPPTSFLPASSRPPISFPPTNPPPPSPPNLSAESDTSEEERVAEEEVEGYRRVHKPAVVKSKARPAGALNKKRNWKSPKKGEPTWSQAFEETRQ